MKTRPILLAAVTLAALAACDAKPAAAPAPATAPSVAPSSSMDAGTLDATSAYLTALAKLDPRLAADRSVALDNGSTICLDIEDRKPAAEQEHNVQARFHATPAQAKEILTIAKNNLCLS
jgi:hypothetical protein